MRAVLVMKQAGLERRVQDEQERLARVAWRLSQIDQEGVMPNHETVLKQVEPQLVASVRGTVPHYPDVGRLMNEVYAYLGRVGAPGGLCASIYHDGEYRRA